MKSKKFHHRVQGTLCRMSLRLKITVLALLAGFQSRSYAVEYRTSTCDPNLVWTISLRMQSGGIVIIDHIDHSPESGNPCPPFLSGSELAICDDQEILNILLYDEEVNSYVGVSFTSREVNLESLGVGSYVLTLWVRKEI